jgi:hypothetical protein
MQKRISAHDARAKGAAGLPRSFAIAIWKEKSPHLTRSATAVYNLCILHPKPVGSVVAIGIL